MLQEATISDRIVEVVRANPHCTLGKITHRLPDLHWTDVFREVAHLSRLGHLRLIQDRSCATKTRSIGSARRSLMSS
ncbi:MAG TPA: hypothetical protein VKB81_00115 [Nitrospira sp.]|nr:hypothetical protein [Nitrospira sp.]